MSTDDESARDDWLRARLSGERASVPAGDPDALGERAIYHGVHVLLADAGVRIARLRDEAMAQAAWELRHREVLVEVLDALAAIDVVPVLFKGTALAYTLYEKPALRARADTDMLVPVQRRGDVERELARIGFACGPTVAGGLIIHQATWVRRLDGIDHQIDLHWRLANSEVLSRAFRYEELFGSSHALPALGAHARIASPPHALLIACLHRAVHDTLPYRVGDDTHVGGDRLIWLYDIHLMVESYDAATLDECRAMAERKGLTNVLADGVERARALFGTRASASLAGHGNARNDPIARYLRAGRMQREWLDFRALEGAGRKLRFVRELVFPPAAYMRAMYGHGALPWLYARRALTGVIKRL